jgi:hypothetical protein
LESWRLRYIFFFQPGVSEETEGSVPADTYLDNVQISGRKRERGKPRPGKK